MLAARTTLFGTSHRGSNVRGSCIVGRHSAESRPGVSAGGSNGLWARDARIVLHGTRTARSWRHPPPRVKTPAARGRDGEREVTGERKRRTPTKRRRERSLHRSEQARVNGRAPREIPRKRRFSGESADDHPLTIRAAEIEREPPDRARLPSTEESGGPSERPRGAPSTGSERATVHRLARVRREGEITSPRSSFEVRKHDGARNRSKASRPCVGAL